MIITPTKDTPINNEMTPNSKVVPDFDIDLSYLEEIANGNTDFIVEMIDLFLQQAPESLEGISERVSKKEWQTAGNLAHKLKPTFAMIGVMAGSKLSERIEKSSRGGYELDNLPELVEELRGISDLAMSKLMKRRLELLAKTT